MIERTCKECGNTFLTKAYNVKRGQGNYCSRGCNGAAAARIRFLPAREALARSRIVEEQPADYKIIRLKTGEQALVSNEDYASLVSIAWSLTKNGYAACGSGYMHRMITQAPSGASIDHVNRNKLDNRRSNLRLADARGNSYNVGPREHGRSKFRGVTPHGDKWIAQITSNRLNIYLGIHRSELEAALAYDVAAIQLAGEFAYLNVIS